MGEEKQTANNGEANGQEQNTDMGSDGLKQTQDTDDNSKSDKQTDETKNDKIDINEDETPKIRASKQNIWKNKYFAEKRIANKKQKEDENDDDDDGIDPEDEEMVNKVVRKHYGSKLDEVDLQADKAELSEFISDNPAFKPYQAKILKFWRDPSRNHLPVETVAMEAVGYKNLVKIGAKLEKQASINAKKEVNVGNSGGLEVKKKVKDMSDKEFDQLTEKVLHSRR